MDYAIIPIQDGHQVKIDLPVDITCMNFSHIFYDEDQKEEKSSTIGFWFVDAGENCPKSFKFASKEFKTVKNAVHYARSVYVKYLKEEIRRVKGVDNDL
jgi:hypothetical protein